MRSPQLIPLTSHRRDTKEALVSSGGACGKLICNENLAGLGQAEDLLVIQHGLPGVEWRNGGPKVEVGIEEKAHCFVSEQEKVAVLVMIATGLRPENVEGANLADHNDMELVNTFCPELFGSQFELENYLSQLEKMVCGIRNAIADRCRIHLAGHSYGASALMRTIRKMADHDVPPPHSVSYLTPFVRNVLLGSDYQGGHPLGLRFGLRDNYVLAKHILHEVLMGTERQYLCSGQHLFDEHKLLFTEDFYYHIDTLAPYLSDTAVQVVMAGADNLITPEHANLVEMIVGRVSRLDMPNEGHDLTSLDLRDLII